MDIIDIVLAGEYELQKAAAEGGTAINPASPLEGALRNPLDHLGGSGAMGAAAGGAGGLLLQYLLGKKDSGIWDYLKAGLGGSALGLGAGALYGSYNQNEKEMADIAAKARAQNYRPGDMGGSTMLGEGARDRAAREHAQQTSDGPLPKRDGYTPGTGNKTQAAPQKGTYSPGGGYKPDPKGKVDPYIDSSAPNHGKGKYW